ncbi:MAG TPA: hypothetical protein VF748_00925 [Candidatus Acidoferrum sp.]
MVTRYEVDVNEQFRPPLSHKSHAFLARADRQDRCFRGGHERYGRQGAAQVVVDLPEIQKLGHRLILDDLLEEHRVIRHNPRRLA